MAALNTLSATFTTTGPTADTPTMFGPWRLAISGTFTGGTVAAEYSPDGGTTLAPCAIDGGTPVASLSAAGANSGDCQIPALVRLDCTAFTSGAIDHLFQNVWGNAMTTL